MPETMPPVSRHCLHSPTRLAVRPDDSLATGVMCWFRSRSCFLRDMKANGTKEASLGPFRLVFEPITFQRLCVYLLGYERGRTAHALAGSFSWVRWREEVGGKRLEGEEDMRSEARGCRRGKVTPYSSGLLPHPSPLQPHSIHSLNLNLSFNLPQSRKTFSMVY